MLSPLMTKSRPTPVPSRVRQILGLASLGLLVAFHAILFWERLANSTLFEPVPAIRWLATVALVAVLYRLHRNGISLLRGRGALVFWLLVLLLHVSFWGPLADPSSTGEGWSGPGLLLALPALTIILGSTAVPLRRLLARLLGGPKPCDLISFGRQVESQSFAQRAGFLPSLACRAPPAA